MNHLPAGTVTFLLTDIEGSTQLLQTLRDDYASVLAEQECLLREIFAHHHGQVVDTQGDSLFAVFPRAIDAIRATSEAQCALASHVWAQGAHVRVRMGLHTGEPVVEGDHYVGMDVHRAARIGAAGHGGQVLLSQTTHDLVESDLPDGVTLRDLGEHRLKDLRQPMHLYQLVISGLPADFPPLKTLDALPNNLPLLLTSFIGREKEIQGIKHRLERTRFLTLTGVGGCGKTRLALQVASEVLEQFRDGVWYVELAPLADAALVPQTVANVLGLREEPGRAILDGLKYYLRQKQVLLVFDNCEHLIEACAQLAETLLHEAPGLRILATSREAVGIAGETAFAVPSLTMPAPSETVPETLTQSEAVRLFIERAVAAQSTFEVTHQNAPAVAQICVRLDGIPLALELAAARVKGLSVQEIAAHLDDRFRLLTGGSRTALPRQRTLQATMDWSYRLLSDQERLLLQRVSVFAGGWTLDAAERVCAGDELARAEILDLLLHLVDKSLVAAETRTEETRYHMLETIRQYAHEKLAQSGIASSVRDLHLDFFLKLARTCEPQLTGPEQGMWIRILDRDYANLRTALAWSKESPGRIEDGLRLATALGRFWAIRDLQGGRDVLASLLSSTSGLEETPLRANALAVAADLASRQGDPLSARTYWEASLAIRRSLGNTSDIASSLRGLGNVAFAIGDFVTARTCYQESLSLSRATADEIGVAGSLSNLGLVAWNEGDYATADQLFRESLALRRAKGDTGGIAYQLNLLGLVAWSKGDYATMRMLNEDSLKIQRELDDRWNMTYSLDSLGLVALAEGDHTAARSYFAESLTYSRELGDKWGISYALERFGALASVRGQPVRAARLFGAAEAFREAISLPMQPGERPQYERHVALARAAVGKELFASAWLEGRALPIWEAIDYALESGSPIEELPCTPSPRELANGNSVN